MFFRRKKPPVVTFEQRLDALRAQGFTVQPSGARFRISKNGCAAVVERSGVAEKPGVEIGGEIARLVDKGYQKFLATSSGQRPALAPQLKAVHEFSEELRRALGLTSLYNESLGTVSDRYWYDRLDGRE